MKPNIASPFENLEESVGVVLTDASQMTQEKIAEGISCTKEFADKAVQMAKEKPVLVLIAVGLLGLTLGYCLKK